MYSAYPNTPDIDNRNTKMKNDQEPIQSNIPDNKRGKKTKQLRQQIVKQQERNGKRTALSQQMATSLS